MLWYSWHACDCGSLTLCEWMKSGQKSQKVSLLVIQYGRKLKGYNTLYMLNYPDSIVFNFITKAHALVCKAQIN